MGFGAGLTLWELGESNVAASYTGDSALSLLFGYL